MGAWWNANTASLNGAAARLEGAGPSAPTIFPSIQPMKTFIIRYSGRKRGAIGIFYPNSVDMEAESVEAAQEKFYSPQYLESLGYEPYCILSIKEKLIWFMNILPYRILSQYQGNNQFAAWYFDGYNQVGEKVFAPTRKEAIDNLQNTRCAGK